MLKEQGIPWDIPYELGFSTTIVPLEIPNEYIESAKRISEKIKWYYEEQGADPEWTITPIDVLGKVLGDSSSRYYEENGEPRQVEYYDLENYPDKVFNYFVWEYVQDK